MTAGGPPVGGLADEAAQLLDALAARLTQLRSTAGQPPESTESTEPTEASEASETLPVDGAAEPVAGHLECVGWCPVCRSADLLRGERPELAGKLVDSAIVVVGALRSLLPSTPAPEQAPGRPGGTAPAPGGTAPAPAPSGIERIDIR